MDPKNTEILSFDPDSPPRLLVVDDDPDHLALVQRWLDLAGVRVDVAVGGREALARIEQQRPDLVITDLVMDDMDGLRLLSEIHRQDPVMPVMILSGKAAIPDALKAAHLGVSAFLTKPIQRAALLEEIAKVLDSAAGQRVEPEDSFGRELVYRSSAMQEVMGRARLVAAGDSTVMVNGETGTGKEVLARAIHDCQRPSRPAIRQHQLQRAAGTTARIGAVRPRKGCVHRRGHPPCRPVPDRRQGHPVSR